MTDSGPDADAVGDGDEESAYVRELEQYRRRLQGAMLAGDLAWWEMDVETGAVSFDDNKVEMLGLPAADFAHFEDFTERVHPDDHDRVMESMRAHLEGRAEKYDVEYRIRAADGEYRWFHDVGGVTARDGDGSPRTVTGIVVEITQRKRTRERLRTTNEQLALLNRIVRHDIRNDMAVVSGWLDLLEEEGLSEEQRANLDRARRAAEHTTQLTEIVRDLLAVLEGDAAGVDLEPTDAVAALDREIDRVRSSYEAVEIRTDYERETVLVRANAMLSSLFGNVLNNAVQHTDEPVARIDVSVRTADRAIVRIADNGPGIPEPIRDELFERETKGPESMGSGLGLYLVHTLVTIYGGSVRVEDDEPTGTVVVVELPLAEAE